uniref:Transmembrane protein n=1 Tax=Daucus carota subsp. sativus TaxID=79200 RepID=A0A161XYD3_DAUCS|nr:PREDICTED: uncharacterized protein LOC108213369 [Daucus carota subsp. sativus]
MEGLKRAVGDAMGKREYGSSSSSSKVVTAAANISSSPSSSSSYDRSAQLLNRSHRQVVSVWTCSKLCAFCFVAGILVGFTLKRRVRRWASRLLRRLKDD